jgi:DNA-binding NarL/FixJ family response regulator
MKKITVLLADDHTLMREGCRMMLEIENDFEVVGEAQDGRQAVELAKKLHPDVALIDIAMPSLNGLEAARQIHQAIPATKVLMLSGHSDDVYIQTATESGAAGFVLKQNSAQDVRQAIREVHQGKTFFSPAIVRHFDRRKLPLPGCGSGRKTAKAQLTSRELEVLQLVAEGNANKQTAAELGINLKTVEKHREHLMEKLDIHHTAGLTQYAIRAGIIENVVPLANA